MSINYQGGITESGQKYVETVTGAVEIGAEVTQYVRENVRRGGVVVPASNNVIGTIGGEGKSFLFRTKEAAQLAGEESPADVFHTRYYF